MFAPVLSASLQPADAENDVGTIETLYLTHEQEVLYSSNHVLDVEYGAREMDCVEARCDQTNRLKIVGGSLALPHEFPWMVYMLITKFNATSLCGGFLVSNRHVITAAHCVTHISHDGIRVILGDHDRSISTDSSSLMIRSERIAIHPQFGEPRRNNNDISVITLKRPVPLSSTIGVVCLPPLKPQNYTGLTATVIGWGKIGIGIDDLASDVLRKAEVLIIDDNECRDTYDEISVAITGRMICAGSPDGGKDSCQGDSGGPLVVSTHGRNVVIGIASFGFLCASATFPGVYTRMDRMLDFIARNTEDGRRCH